MAVIEILQYPDKRLKRIANKVEDFGDEFQAIVDDMFETHYNAKNCAALAATQLSLEPAPHVTVIDFSPTKSEPFCIVNGEITAREGTQKEEEGCMSVGCDIDIFLHAHVKRAMKITLKAQDRHGMPFEMDAEGFMAKCIQHELDHLDGKIFLDHLTRLKRERLIAKYKKELKCREQE